MIGNLVTALRQGWILSNAASWKNRQIAVNALVAFAGAAFGIAKAYGYEINIDEESLSALSGGVVGLVLLFNGWATIVTSTKVGLPVRGEADPEQAPDGPGDQPGVVDDSKAAGA